MITQTIKKLQNINRLKITIILALSVLVGIALVLYRIHISGTITYLFLVWNMFLALIPYGISLFLRFKTGLFNKTSSLIIPLLLWLLFLPNTAYILTDLIHLHARPPVSIWFDLVLISFFAWNGLILGIVSTLDIQKVLGKRLKPLLSNLLVFACLGLSSVGVYIGRFLRFNSWDSFTNPLSVWNTFKLSLNNNTHVEPFLFISIVFIFLSLSFLTMQSIENK